MLAMTPASDGDWKTNPVVGLAAVILLVLAILIGFRCSRREAASEPPPNLPKEEGVVLICPHCQSQYTITGKDVRDDRSDDQLVAKALRKPCPKCGKTGSIPAIPCMKCGKYFSPIPIGPPVAVRGAPEDPEAARRGGIRCPHCGQDPFTK